MTEIFGVVGAGTMGNGITQVAARAGFKVVMRDVAPEFLTRGMGAIDKSLQRDVEKDRLSAGEKQSIVDRIQTTTDLSDLRDAFIIVEAVTEDLSVKSEVFKTLDGIAGA
ncbi:MAG TPA: 3-hydroxyacyl-CoA dehydrogenase NAD-binding domain-containing protein, partial [Pyrinomonadaceae bacterium]|nr:3-hydroxyacyl-CoA dehydrogenase NAD-binding domain-containing protein [Pyrinomonadaceae bacterium]